MGSTGFGIDPTTLERIASEVAEVRSLGVEVALVIGGGNIFRGAQALNINRSSGGCALAHSRRCRPVIRTFGA